MPDARNCPRIDAVILARAEARARPAAKRRADRPAASRSKAGTRPAPRKKARARPRARAWHVYLVRCADGSLYCGVSNDLPARVAAHNAGRGAKYTRPRRPVTLVWSRRCGTKSNACRQEYRIKQLTRAEKQALAGV